MARMIPPLLSPDVKSSGEKQVFQLLQQDPGTQDWGVLHSLGLARHVTRLYGEIDFVVLVPGHGVFCLEVKSGSVSRRGGVWTFTNRFGELADHAGGRRQRAAVAHCTIQGFKGLENTTIILHDIDTIAGEESRSLLYVGMSRARERLTVVMTDACKAEYESAVRTNLQRSLAR
jgi:hypothetical protein